MPAAQLLQIAGHEFRFAARAPMRMPGYSGSAWRGGFGRALRRAVCITGLETCPGCRFQASCVYPYVFETPPGAEGGILADYERVPNPFVLAPRWPSERPAGPGIRGEAGSLAAGAEATVRLVLIGRAIEHAALARQAVVEAGWRGLGPDRGALDLAAAEPVAPPPAEPCPDRITIELSSPLRLVEAGRLVGPDALRPRHLLMSLLRRVSLLAERHGPAPLDLDYRGLKASAETAEFADQSLCWAEWRRWSGRQRQLVPMGGLLGTLALPLRGLEPFWSFWHSPPGCMPARGRRWGSARCGSLPHERRLLPRPYALFAAHPPRALWVVAAGSDRDPVRARRRAKPAFRSDPDRDPDHRGRPAARLAAAARSGPRRISGVLP
jgi:hypothetical protein